MLNFFWPQTDNPNPNGLVHFGRALHLVGSLVVLVVVTGCAPIIVLRLGSFASSGDWVWFRVALGLPFFLPSGAFAIYMVGRWLRFMLSGE